MVSAIVKTQTDTYEITLDQIEYIKGISVIVHPELRSKDEDEFCSDAVH